MKLSEVAELVGVIGALAIGGYVVWVLAHKGGTEFTTPQSEQMSSAPSFGTTSQNPYLESNPYAALRQLIEPISEPIFGGAQGATTEASQGSQAVTAGTAGATGGGSVFNFINNISPQITSTYTTLNQFTTNIQKTISEKLNYSPQSQTENYLYESTSEKCGGGWFSLAACGGQQQGGASLGGPGGSAPDIFSSFTKQFTKNYNLSWGWW